MNHKNAIMEQLLAKLAVLKFKPAKHPSTLVSDTEYQITVRLNKQDAELSEIDLAKFPLMLPANLDGFFTTITEKEKQLMAVEKQMHELKRKES